MRLLGYNPSQKRHVSAGVLESGDSFGADTLVGDRTLPYQVRAVSSGLVARMAETQLNQWVERLPLLQDYLTSTISHRQRLLFLKTNTELADIPSQDLQQLLPYLDAEQIPTGEPLIQSTPADAGRFWLRHGDIASQKDDSSPPNIGDSWGYPQTIPEDWIAQTDLSVYYVVVYWCKGDRMLVADPAVGRRKISRQAFLEGWTGYALLIEPTERLKEVESQKTSFGKFISALSPYRMLIGQIILASLLIQLFGLITPLFTQIILDRVVIHKSFITLHVFAVGLLL